MTNSIKEEKVEKDKPTIRSTRKQGGSIVLSLTGFSVEGEFFDIRKISNSNILLTKIDLGTIVK